MKNKLTVVIAATGMAFLGFQGAASAAPGSTPSGDVSVMGWPTGCSDVIAGNGWSVYCRNGNGGSYKASVICGPLDGGPKVTRDAVSWVRSGWSYVSCPPLTGVISGGFWSRSY
ncbi:hypothetical protein ACIQXD_29275 [Streptomyces uncialis]|uniref:hypothetical protein n=1 Tax=Streptomyces uncialis TaxID=1048205 RepID=UPI003823403B